MSVERSIQKIEDRDGLISWWENNQNKPVRGTPSLGSIRKQMRDALPTRKAIDQTWDNWWSVEEARRVSDFIGHDKRVSLIRKNT